MTTTTTATECPIWCQHHLNDDDPDFGFSGVVHQRKVEVGDISVTIQETTGDDQHLDPAGPIVVDLDDWEWISEDTIRHLAQALIRAADLIEAGRS